MKVNILECKSCHSFYYPYARIDWKFSPPAEQSPENDNTKLSQPPVKGADDKTVPGEGEGR